MEKISVILPVYNESNCIANTFDEVLHYSQDKPHYQFIFVNDGSTDNTQSILEKKLAASQTSKIKIVAYNCNQGKGYAVKKGIESSWGEIICFIDSDLAYSLDHLDFLVDKLGVFDVAIGCRNMMPDRIKKVKFKRRIAGKIFNFISRKILDLKHPDMQAGIKGFTKEAAEILFAKQTLKGYCFDVELIYLANKYGYNIAEIPAIVSDIHLHKNSKVNLVVDSLKMLFSLLKIKLNDTLGVYE